jgi:hypothetical protein
LLLVVPAPEEPEPAVPPSSLEPASSSANSALVPPQPPAEVATINTPIAQRVTNSSRTRLMVASDGKKKSRPVQVPRGGDDQATLEKNSPIIERRARHRKRWGPAMAPRPPLQQKMTMSVDRGSI